MGVGDWGTMYKKGCNSCMDHVDVNTLKLKLLVCILT
uniref:Uncharacterized protein n=1 Tax=Anguilla anguilla TaxID=7936 RepID=A0A0E9PWT7_ANGAN